MNIHEHQAKQILKKYGVKVPEGIFAFDVEELLEKAKSLNTKKYVLKAQIHAGGRGKAGGVKLTENLDELEKEAKEIFSDEQMLPAIGQGVIALQCRLDDQKILDILKNINDQESYFCVQAERALLEVLEGDCDTAVGGLAKLWNNKIILKSELFSNDGSKKFVAEGSGNFKEAGKIGYKVGKELLKKAGPDFKV